MVPVTGIRSLSSCNIGYCFSLSHSVYWLHTEKTIPTTGTTSQDEEVVLKESFGVEQRVVPINYAGVKEDGSTITGSSSIANAMALSWKLDHREFRAPREALGEMLRGYKRRIIKTLDMSPL
jgi:hypothetical protein